MYNSPQSAANQGTFALSSGAVGVGGSVSFVTVPIFGPTLTLATGSQNGTLTLSGATPFTFSGGGSSTFTPNGASATVNYSGAAQTAQGATYQNLILSGSGSKTTAGITVNGTLSMQGTATATAVPAYGVNSTLEYKGSAAQTTGPELAAGLASLTINNTNGVTVGISATVTNTLTLAAGRLITGANQINLATNGSVSGASAASYVNGNLRKAFSAAPRCSLFPSVTVLPRSFGAVEPVRYTAGSLSASTTSGSHPQFASSGLDANRNVNRNWTLTQSGGTFGTYSATFNYPATEVDTNTMPSPFSVARWNGQRLVRQHCEWNSNHKLHCHQRSKRIRRLRDRQFDALVQRRLALPPGHHDQSHQRHRQSHQFPHVDQFDQQRAPAIRQNQRQ